MIEHERAIVAAPVREREHVFVDVAVGREHIEQQEVAHIGEHVTALEQREDLALVALDEPAVRGLLLECAPEFHPVPLGESLDLPVAEHRQAGQRDHQRAHAEVLVALPELVHRRPLVGVAHEVDVALEHFRIELQGVLDHRAVIGVLLVTQHVHERAVVHAVHAEGADEEALHHPERLGEQQRIGSLRRHPIHDFAPELDRHGGVELGLGEPVFSPRRDRAAAPRLREPQSLVVALGQRHRRVEPDDRERPRHLEDRPDHRLAHVGLEVVELGGVVPGHHRAVVAVVDEPGRPGAAIDPHEHHGRVAAVVVMILEEDPDARIGRQIRTVKRVRGEWRVVEREEAIGMLQHPARVDPGVVRNHVARESDAAPPRALAQARQRCVAAEIRCDPVVTHRVRRRRGVGIPAQLLDALRRRASLPEPDQPQARDAPALQPLELRVGDLVETVDRAPVGARKLVEPHVRALGDQHHARHPVAVGAEALRLALQLAKLGDRHAPAQRSRPREPQETRALLLVDHVERDEQPAQQVAEQVAPAIPDVFELARERVGRGQRRAPEHVDQVLMVGTERRLAGEEPAERGDQVRIPRLTLELRIVEQLEERGERRVRVREPQQQQLLERDLAVGEGAGPSPEVILGARPVPVDRERREQGREPAQCRLDRAGADPRAQELERPRLNVVAPFRPIQPGDEMQDLVDEAHGVKLAGLDRPLGMPAGVAHLVHAQREPPGRSQVGDDDVAAEPEPGGVERVALARRPRDVELEQRRDGRGGGTVRRRRAHERAIVTETGAGDGAGGSSGGTDGVPATSRSWSRHLRLEPRVRTGRGPAGRPTQRATRVKLGSSNRAYHHG